MIVAGQQVEGNGHPRRLQPLPHVDRFGREIAQIVLAGGDIEGRRLRMRV